MHYYRCACDTHMLEIERDDDYTYLTTRTTDPEPLAWRARIRYAFAALCGRPHETAEIILDNTERDRLIGNLILERH